MANTPARVCPLAKKCGGCQLQNLSYDEQLHLKQATAIRLLGRFGHVEEIIGMKDPYHYRNKVQAAFGVNRQGQIISGVYQSASHRIVPVSDCISRTRSQTRSSSRSAACSRASRSVPMTRTPAAARCGTCSCGAAGAAGRFSSCS